MFISGWPLKNLLKFAFLLRTPSLFMFPAAQTAVAQISGFKGKSRIHRSFFKNELYHRHFEGISVERKQKFRQFLTVLDASLPC